MPYFAACAGYKATYGSYSKYYCHMKKKENQEKHKGFLNARKEWVRQHEANPDRTRLTNKDELMAATTLTKEKALGGRFTGPKLKFVTEAGFKPSLHGEWGPEKVVTQEIFGEKKEGIWVLAGDEGVFDYEAYDDRSFREANTQHVGDDNIFADEALQRKRKANTDLFQAAAKARASTAVKGKELSPEDLVQRFATGAASSSKAAADAASGQGSKFSSKTDVETIASSEGDKDESDEDEEHEGGFFGGAAKKAKAKAKAKNSSSKPEVAANPQGKPKRKTQQSSAAVAGKSEAGTKQTKPKPTGTASSADRGWAMVAYAEPPAGMHLGI